MALPGVRTTILDRYVCGRDARRYKSGIVAPVDSMDVEINLEGRDWPRFVSLSLEQWKECERTKFTKNLINLYNSL